MRLIRGPGPDEPADSGPALSQHQVSLLGVGVVVDLVRILGNRGQMQRLADDRLVDVDSQRGAMAHSPYR
jgi:hypothetical protein